MLVTYTSKDEVIIASLDDEDRILESYFGPEIGRNIEEYDREEGDDIRIESNMHVRTYMNADRG